MSFTSPTRWTGGRPVAPHHVRFNGGPGAASAFLHLGAMGPRGVNFTPTAPRPLQPVALADNPDTWLGFTDLVFVDPVATGYSRSAGGTEEADQRLLRRREGCRRDGRLRAALSDAGGTHAVAGVPGGRELRRLPRGAVANRLLASGIAVHGAVLISPALEFSLLRGNALRAAAR